MVLLHRYKHQSLLTTPHPTVGMAVMMCIKRQRPQSQRCIKRQRLQSQRARAVAALAESANPDLRVRLVRTVNLETMDNPAPLAIMANL